MDRRVDDNFTDSSSSSNRDTKEEFENTLAGDGGGPMMQSPGVSSL